MYGHYLKDNIFVKQDQYLDSITFQNIHDGSTKVCLLLFLLALQGSVLITVLLTCEGASQTEHLLMNGRTCSPDTGFIIGVMGSGVDNQ